MNLEDLAKKTINEISSEIKELERQKELLKKQELKEEKTEEQDLEIIEAPLEIQPEIQEDFPKEEKEKKEQENKEHSKIEQQILHSNLESEEKQELSSEVLNASVIMQMQSLGEDIFLKNLRERILVLFEGLNHIKKEDLEQRLNLTIHFLEFLLANIEDKLKK